MRERVNQCVRLVDNVMNVMLKGKLFEEPDECLRYIELHISVS